MRIGNHLNFNQYEARSLRLENLAADPVSPVEGQVHYRSNVGQKIAYFYNGTTFIPMDATKFVGAIPIAALVTDPLARANHTGTQLASTVSNFDTQVRTSRLDQMAAPAANVALGGYRLTGIADAIAGSDVPSLSQVQAYADSAAAGVDAKPSVVATTTGNIVLSGLGTQANGDWGGALTAGNRILVKDQTSGQQNGVYTAAAGAWTRSTDMDTTAEYTSQAFVFVEQGTTLASTQWKVSTTTAIVVGTTVVVWAQWGVGLTYVGSNGVSIVGSAVTAVVEAGKGVLTAAAGLSVDRTKVPFKFAASIGNGAALSFVVNHALATTDITVGVYQISDGSAWLIDWSVTDANNISVGPFATAPTASQFRVVVIG